MVGVYFLNWQYCRAIIGGAEHIDQLPIDLETVHELWEKCDLVWIMEGTDLGLPHDEIPERLARAIDQLPDENIPEFVRNDKGQMATLRTSQVTRVPLLTHIPVSVCGGSLKDAWRPVYNVWHREQFPKIVLLWVDPLTDKYGNSYCSSMPAEMVARITKPLLLPHFRSIEEVRENIKDIEGLSVTYFVYDPMMEYLYAQFTVGDRYWNFGIPL